MAPRRPAVDRPQPEGTQPDLRQQVAASLVERREMLSADAATVFPYGGTAPVDEGYGRRIGDVYLRLLAVAVRDGRAEARGGLAADLYRVTLERAVSSEQLFAFAYLVERTVLDDLASSTTLGATTDVWPAVAQFIRRASFDVLAAFSERAQLEPTMAAIVDPLTTVYTRPLMEAVLAKEAERAGRFGYPISLILLDVDNLSRINAEHGYGVGDRILERIGILIRSYFRQHDWVARFSEDSFAVLLTRTEPDRAADLAQHVRQMVEERLALRDHRTDSPVPVTMSAAVVNVPVGVGDTIDPERLMVDAEAAVERAKTHRPNSVERVDGYSGGVVRAKTTNG